MNNNKNSEEEKMIKKVRQIRKWKRQPIRMWAYECALDLDLRLNLFFFFFPFWQNIFICLSFKNCTKSKQRKKISIKRHAFSHEMFERDLCFISFVRPNLFALHIVNCYSTKSIFFLFYSFFSDCCCCCPFERNSCNNNNGNKNRQKKTAHHTKWRIKKQQRRRLRQRIRDQQIHGIFCELWAAVSS